MAFTPRRSGDGLKAEINVTPLVDVVLVLLIIFMVVTPMLTRGREVQLPVAKTASAEHELIDAVVLTIARDKELWLETERVAPNVLEKVIAARLRKRPDLAVLVKADAGLTVRDLRPVLQALQSARVAQLAFAVLGPERVAP